MPANTDKFMYVGLSTATTLFAPGYTAGNTSITVGSTTNWPTASGVTFAIDTVTIVNGEEVQDAGSYNEFVGTVATGTTITNVDWVDGAGDTDYSAGSTTRVYIPVSKTRENRLVEGMLVEHDQDGTHGAITGASATLTGTVQGATVISTGDIQHRSVSLETIRSEMEFDYVASGCVWSGDSYGSTRAASMTAGVVYIGGKRISVALVTARSFTASKDTYIDVDNTGTLVYTEVTNNAASPALAANSIRLGIIVTDGTDIQDAGSVNQGEETKVLPIASSVAYSVTDSLGNLICPRDPNRHILGYRQYTSNVTTTSASLVDITGLSLNAIVPDGRKVRVSVKDGEFTRHSIAGSGVWLATYDATAGVVIEEHATTATGVNYAFNNSIIGKPYTPPTSGVRNFKAQFGKTIATGTIIASTTTPITLTVELV